MKWYSYLILTAICELLSIFSINSYSDNSADLLRIVYLEKTALRDFSFNPFPLFVMLCSLMNIILSIIFITSNIPKKEFIISRFNSRQQYFGYLIKKQTANALITSAAMTVAPVLFTALLCGFSDITKLAALYFLRQFVLLYFASGISLILLRSLNSGAADIAGAVLMIVLIMIDVFTDIPTALIDLSGQNLVSTGCEAVVCVIATFGCFELFRNEKEI